MQIGDTVMVRASGRRARIVAELGRDRYQVEYLPETMSDPMDRDTAQSEDEGGIYAAGDLAPFE
jgi:hypothetical protein